LRAAQRAGQRFRRRRIRADGQVNPTVSHVNDATGVTGHAGIVGYKN
jgi:hypothetical protein